jgi:acetyl-CoA synthetase
MTTETPVSEKPDLATVHQVISKSAQEWRVAPNLKDYPAARSAFTWAAARGELDGLPGGQGLNIAYEAIDRHARGALRGHLAIRWMGKNGEIRNYTYGDLQLLTNRFANVLKKLGARKGDRVYVLAGRIPELYIAALGTLKHGCVFCPMFSAFGPQPIKSRMAIGGAKFLVTTQSLYERKVRQIRNEVPTLEHVLVVAEDPELKQRRTPKT